MKITIYTITDCPFSKQEKEFLASHNLQYEEKNLETNKEFLTEMLAVSNNFAGTPVTKIEKDDGQIAVLKGFTTEEFNTTLNLSAPANPAPAEPVAPPTPAPSPMPHTDELAMPPMAVAAATMSAPTMPPSAPTPPAPQTPIEPTPQPPAAPAIDPDAQEAAATMSAPKIDEPTTPPSPPPMPEPTTPPIPSPIPPAPSPTTPPVPVDTAPSNDKLNSILQNLQQRVDTMPSAAPANPTITTPSAAPTTPTTPNIPAPDFH